MRNEYFARKCPLRQQNESDQTRSFVSEPITTLLGGPEMYINKGSTMNLTCIIKHSPEPPPAIYWTHDGVVRTYLKVEFR